MTLFSGYHFIQKVDYKIKNRHHETVPEISLSNIMFNNKISIQKKKENEKSPESTWK